MLPITVQWKDNYYKGYNIVEKLDELDNGNGDIPIEYMNLLERVREVKKIPSFIRVSGREEDNKSTDVLFERVNNIIRTGNFVGVVNSPVDENGRSLRLEISSRFDCQGKHFFLLYLLSTVYGFELYNDAIQSEKSTSFDAIVCVLFLEKLKDAYENGLYKVYRTFKHNDYNFKGTFDVSRHIKVNTPFSVMYDQRNFVCCKKQI